MCVCVLLPVEFCADVVALLLALLLRLVEDDGFLHQLPSVRPRAQEPRQAVLPYHLGC